MQATGSHKRAQPSRAITTMRASVFWLSVVACIPSVAFSSSIDRVGLGSGRDGTVQLAGGEVVVNRYFKLLRTVVAGESRAQVPTTTGVLPGQLVLLHQTQGYAGAVVSGDQRPLELDEAGSVAHYEVRRVAQVGADWMAFDAPLGATFRAPGAQLVLVPEYENVIVRAITTVTAPAWNGETGGIVAFLARGAVTMDGNIDVSGRGFRGGAPTTSWVVTNQGRAVVGCESLDGPVDPSGDSIPSLGNGVGGARKGEGLGVGALDGRGNITSGGGGGNCHNAGGGGGGGFGRGGKGMSWSGDERDTGGMPGTAVVSDLLRRLTLGGGGGAGEENNGEPAQMAGAPGGGIIWLRAQSWSGRGGLRASGAHREGMLPRFNDGEGGGGGGGSIVVRVQATSSCPASVVAVGGNGGSTQTNHGPGGGGGGGQVLLQFPGVTCAADVKGGVGGIDEPVTTRQAEDGEGGRVMAELGGGFPTAYAPQAEARICDSTVTGDVVSVVRTTPGAQTEWLVDRDSHPSCSVRADSDGLATCTLRLSAGTHALHVYSVADSAQGDLQSPDLVCNVITEPECEVHHLQSGLSCGASAPVCDAGHCRVCMDDSDCGYRGNFACRAGACQARSRAAVVYKIAGSGCSSFGDARFVTSMLPFTLTGLAWLLLRRRRSAP